MVYELYALLCATNELFKTWFLFSDCYMDSMQKVSIFLRLFGKQVFQAQEKKLELCIFNNLR